MAAMTSPGTFIMDSCKRMTPEDEITTRDHWFPLRKATSCTAGRAMQRQPRTKNRPAINRPTATMPARNTEAGMRRASRAPK